MAAVEVPPSNPSRPSSLTITWMQSPQTTVVLYRTRKPVDEQARSRDEILESQLAAAHLPEEARLNSRLAAVDGSDDPARAYSMLYLNLYIRVYPNPNLSSHLFLLYLFFHIWCCLHFE